jgi:hypothetical protein
MEILTGLKVPRSHRSLVAATAVDELWRLARQHVEAYRADELEMIWKTCHSRHLHGFTEHEFMLELAWVISVSGFSARVVGKKFRQILEAHAIEDRYGRYIYPAEGDVSMADILRVWGNKKKAIAIQSTRELIRRRQWATVYSTIYPVSPGVLRQFSYIGPTLACHLARNLGDVNSIKPDKHLKRLAAQVRQPSPEALCQECQKLEPGYHLGKIDLVLWIAAVDLGTL